MNMSIRDIIKRSFIDSSAFTEVDIRKMLLALVAALVMGIIIYLIYSRFYTGVVFSRSFAITLVGMCVLTCMVTLAISTNVVISLGMVGSLSIVRFRTAVKDPLDLLYLFWSISVGITLGANMYVLALAASAIMFILVLLMHTKQQKGALYVAVIHYDGDKAGDEIIRALGRMRFYIKSKTMRKEKTEIAIEILCRNNDLSIAEKIRAIAGVEDVTMIQYNGEYHG